MEEVYATLLSSYGPFAVFLLLMLSGIGLPLGEDIIIIPAGILVGHDSLDLLPTAFCAYVGVVGADLLWFAICSRYGTPLLHRRWFKRLIHPRRLLEIKHEIDRRGTWVIVAARFIPSSRTTAITTAGVLHFPFWKFALAEVVCCLVTVPMQLGIGYAVAVGFGTRRTADLVRAMIAVIVLVALVMALVASWRQARRLRRRAPRAKARWLRRSRPVR